MIRLCADLQRKRISHRNLKPSNIALLDEDNFKNVKLYNFEMAHIFESPDNNIELDVETSSVIYSSPKILDVLHRHKEAKESFMVNESFQNLELYNPFIEDVFSLGLITL